MPLDIKIVTDVTDLIRTLNKIKKKYPTAKVFFSGEEQNKTIDKLALAYIPSGTPDQEFLKSASPLPSHTHTECIIVLG